MEEQKEDWRGRRFCRDRCWETKCPDTKEEDVEEETKRTREWPPILNQHLERRHARTGTKFVVEVGFDGGRGIGVHWIDGLVAVVSGENEDAFLVLVSTLASEAESRAELVDQLHGTSDLRRP